MEARGLRALICVLVVVACFATILPAASAIPVGEVGSWSVAAQEPANESDQSAESLNESGQLEEADEVHIDVYVLENGSATFVVDYRFNNASSDAWEALREDVEEHPDAYADAEAEDWNEIRERAQNATDREMELSGFSVETDTSSAPREMGHVVFTFQWSSFAHVEPALIEVGDALAGFTLVDDTTLQLFWPDGYAVHDVDPAPDSPPEGSIFWDGDGTEFADGQPRVVLIQNDESTEPDEPDEDPSNPWLVVGAALGVLAAVAAAGLWARHDERRRRSEPDPARQEPTDAGEAPGPRQPPEELLSNEERVLRLLERRGGRVKQQEVVSELDWTEAKTSQVVGNLREDGEIEVFRIGRENVLALPEDEE